MKKERPARIGDRSHCTPVVFAVIALLLSAAAGAADKDCWKPICREGFRWNGQRCEGARGGGALSGHYDPPRPLCRPGWSVRGQYCLEDGCCVMPACGTDETYRDRQCVSNVASIGPGAVRPAACSAGWALQPASGMCKKTNCGALPIRVSGHTALPCVDRGGPVTIYGENFGADQGRRRIGLLVAGHTEFARVTAWDETAISLLIPVDPRIESGQTYFIGVVSEVGAWWIPLVRVRICGAPE